jgi:hypothetical protein
MKTNYEIQHPVNQMVDDETKKKLSLKTKKIIKKRP